MLRDALTTLLGVAKLSDVLFPGDRVLLVPDGEFAVEPEILAEIVGILLEAGCEKEALSILLTEEEEKSTATALSVTLPKEITTILNHPDRRDRLALRGVDADDRPIALNRELVDADMIITVGRYHPKKKAGKPKDYFGLHTAIYPRFADGETRRRFESAKGTERRRLQSEVNEVARQLGVMFTIQFLRQRGKPDRIVAGLSDLVAEQLETVT